MPAAALAAPEELVEDPGAVTWLDVRWQLGRRDGPEQYATGHVPGAAYVDLDTDLADPPGPRGRHPLPDGTRFSEAMRRAGVDCGRPVVVYDDWGARAAARAWWLLRHHGHDDVRVLDGGWSAWVAAGGPVQTGPVTPASGDFEAQPGRSPVLDAAGAAAVAAAGGLVDARPGGRFQGVVEPVDPVAGHIPGALNVPTDANLAPTGRFRRVEELSRIYAPVLRSSGPVGASCGSGVTACHALLALHLLGEPAALYAGSWSEWITDPTRPVATGPGGHGRMAR